MTIRAPPRWTRREGIDGLPYYYTTALVKEATYITEVDITADTGLKDTLAGIRALEDFIQEKSDTIQPMPRNRQVYVECRGLRVAYYMVNNLSDGQCIFWLRQFDVFSNIGYPIYSTPHLSTLCIPLFLHERGFDIASSRAMDVSRVLDALRTISSPSIIQ